MRLKPTLHGEPDTIQTDLREGISTKRHEFIEKGKKDAFVVFEGEDGTPFWRRENDGIRFVFTDLDFRKALALTARPESFLDHTVTDTDGGEFLRYYREAWEKHTAPIP
ncbi:hypothetical protein KW785_02755 [Candidatus Parcubacteria bacterium]|nr:hypothetical protein [Candidatus Parcubacteria bacterium]